MHPEFLAPALALKTSDHGVDEPKIVLLCAERVRKERKSYPRVQLIIILSLFEFAFEFKIKKLKSIFL